MSDERPAMTDGLGRSFKVTYHYSPELTSHIRALIAEAIRAERGRIVGAIREEARVQDHAASISDDATSKTIGYEIGGALTVLADRLENLP